MAQVGRESSGAAPDKYTRLVAELEIQPEDEGMYLGQAAVCRPDPRIWGFQIMSKYGNPENDARLVLTKSALRVGPEKRSYSQRQFTDEKPTSRY